jgi:hypothetical protein
MGSRRQPSLPQKRTARSRLIWKPLKCVVSASALLMMMLIGDVLISGCTTFGKRANSERLTRM